MCSGLLKTLLLISVTAILCNKGGNTRRLAKAINKFGDDLYKELAKGSGNIIFSPFSVHTVLALLTSGAGGKTQKELLSKLHLANMHHLLNDYTLLHAERINYNDHNPHIANGLFYDAKFSLQDKFKINANSAFIVTPQKVDFTKPKEAAIVVNKWISNETNHTIPKMVDDDSFDDQTELLLLNAIHFKGIWKIKFNKSKTIKNAIFHTPTEDVTCNMMVMDRQRLRSAVFHDFKLVELSFHNSDIKIAFIRPRFNKTIANIEKIINGRTFFNRTINLRPLLVDLQLPKFKLSTDNLLREALISIGVADIFKAPNFSHLFEQTTPQKVDNVRQKTVIEINEDGATAVAATSVQLIARSPEIPQELIFNRPFLFFLFDSKMQVILISGRVENPVAVSL